MAGSRGYLSVSMRFSRRACSNAVALAATFWLTAVIGALAFAQNAGQAAHPTAAEVAAGKKEFNEYCAQCHGANGKGNGPESDIVPGMTPPDLTKLAAQNGGKFPFQKTFDSIDGRQGIPSHKRFDMPFWGVSFQESGKEFTRESEAKAKARIDAVVAYIETIQTK